MSYPLKLWPTLEAITPGQMVINRVMLMSKACWDHPHPPGRDFPYASIGKLTPVSDAVL